MIINRLKIIPRKKKKIIYGIFLAISDLFFLIISFLLSYYLRFFIPFFDLSRPTYTFDTHYILYSSLFICLTIVFIGIYRLYDWDTIYRGSGYYSRIFKAVSINILLIIIIGYILETFSFSRIWIVLLYIFSIFFLFASRSAITQLTNTLVKKLGLYSKTLIVGIGENSRRVKHTLEKYKVESYKIVGYVDKKSKLKNKDLYKEFHILGYLKNIKEIILNNNIQKVVISGKEYNYNEILDILEQLKSLDVLVLMFPGFFEFSINRARMREIAGIPLLQVSNVGFFGIDLFYKNLMDYILAGLLFIISIPLFIVIAFLIKIDSRGPILYKQTRYTKNFKPFIMYKFRTMYQDADQRLAEFRKYNEADGPIFKIKKDPRVTKVGRFLRKFSLDELPQIINVLKGDISLVGPRPPIPEEVEKYEEWQKKRLNVKQGITGLWQVSGRSNLSFEEMVRLDLYYIQNWSIGMDLKILLKTLPTVLFAHGAY